MTAAEASAKLLFHLLHEKNQIVGVLFATSTLRLSRILPVNARALEAVRIHKCDQGLDEDSPIRLRRNHVSVGVVGLSAGIVEGPPFFVSIVKLRAETKYIRRRLRSTSKFHYALVQ